MRVEKSEVKELFQITFLRLSYGLYFYILILNQIWCFKVFKNFVELNESSDLGTI